MLFILFSCNGFVLKKHIIGNYYLTAPDIIEQISLSQKEKTSNSNYSIIVGAVVFSVGFDNAYIYLKQYPNYPHKDRIDYYIVPIKDDYNRAANKYGPYTLSEFKIKCNEFNITDINFSINIEI